MFKVMQVLPDEVILGQDDHHLDFRLSLQAKNGFLSIYTLVKPHNLLGVVYLICILPFHFIIAARVSRSMAVHLKNKASQ